jgi:hypothetical protein
MRQFVSERFGGMIVKFNMYQYINHIGKELESLMDRELK